MKFGDHFFTFYLISPLKIQILYYDLILLFIYLLNIPFFTLGFIFYFNHYNDEELLLGLIFLFSRKQELKHFFSFVDSNGK